MHPLYLRLKTASVAVFFEMGLFCIYAGTVPITRTQHLPRPLKICPYYFPAYLNIYIHTYTQ